MEDDTVEGNGAESIYGSEKKKLGIRKHCNTLYLRKEVVQSSIDLEKDWLKAGLAQRRVAPWRKASSERGSSKMLKGEVMQRRVGSEKKELEGERWLSQFFSHSLFIRVQSVNFSFRTNESSVKRTCPWGSKDHSSRHVGSLKPAILDTV